MPSLLKKILIIFTLIGLLVSVGLYWLKYIHPYETTDDSYLKAHIATITANTTGYVQEVLFQDNQNVKQYDLLVKVYDQDYQARLVQAEAKVQEELAHIHTLQTDKLTKNAKVSQEVADINAAEAGLERAAKDLRRFGNLVADGAVSMQSRDSAEASHKQALAQRDKVLSARTEAESGLLGVDAQISESRAALKANQAQVELAKINLGNTKMIAPMTGIIGNRTVQVGQLLKPGAVLAYLIPENSVFVEANFKETQITDMRVGQQVEIMVDAYPDHVFSGVVDSFSPASGSEFSLLPPENATGNFTKIVRRVPVKIVFQPDNLFNQLKPGLSSTVKVKVR